MIDVFNEVYVIGFYLVGRVCFGRVRDIRVWGDGLDLGTGLIRSMGWIMRQNQVLPS